MVLAGLGVVGLCAIVSVSFLMYFTQHAHPASAVATGDFTGYRMQTILIDDQRIRVAVANTPALQALGLGKRTGLGSDEGMLFVFPDAQRYGFWMKDMQFSIDMIWIASDGTIEYMAQNVAPETYPEDFVPPTPALYVLEVPAGYAQAHNFVLGDVVHF
jgi:uncharacterized membrane protein (UPF0127 family)